MKSSIIVLIPYFGKWPFWMDVFLASCERNPDIHWLLISDCGRPEKLPENVIYREQSFSSYKQTVSARLGVDFSSANAYKVCDARPMFGVIHEEDIRGYDFWAFGDLDLVYGDLRSIFTEDLLRKYNLISNHATRVSGHLCLIRNTSEMREAFKRIPRWREEITAERHCSTDEKSFSRLFVKHKNFPTWLRRFTNLLYPLVRKSLFVERYTTPNGYIAWKDGSGNYPSAWFWFQGKIWNDFEEVDAASYPYFHFYSWKKNWNPMVDMDLTDSSLYVFECDSVKVIQDYSLGLP